jgi:hypothetical protein
MRIDGAKVGTATGTNFSLKSNDGRVVTLDGVLGHSDGVTTLDITLEKVVPFVDIDGSQDKILELMANKANAELEITAGNRVLTALCRCVMYDGKSTVTDGKLDGTANFENSGPITFV